jgi:hypothetical protein
MEKTRIGWIKGMFLLCMFFTALSSNTFAKEEIKAPMLTGELWLEMTPDMKTAYIWGAGDIVDLEQEFMEIYPELKRESFAMKAVEGIGDVTINEIVATVDAFYKKNPEKVDRSVIRVIWDEMIKPNIKTGIAGRPLD